uniref:Pantoate--beta-alanine ligase n=1 Tax=Chenopodium quinoa TaxID=63459 RepID=A0A803LAI6_CHEQI
MGYLHKGHLSLVSEAHQHADLVVVSIYVNPGQFSTSEDLSTYPSDFHGDIQKLMSVPGGVDVVFNPYDLYDYGRGRDSKGVATVVSKLFNIVEPDVAIFGKKDYQQWRLICRMVRDLDFSVQIIGSEITREDDGLAMSSRNVYLSPEEWKKALSINRSLSKAKHAAENGQISCKRLQDSIILAIEEAGGNVDYAEIVDQETLEVVEEIKAPVVICVAACFGKTRLIDNMEIST